MSVFIKKKFIGNDQVDGAKILLLNDQSLRAKNSFDGASVEVLKFSIMNELELLTPASTQHDPYAGNHLTRKSYVDGQIEVERARALARESELQNEIDFEESRAQAREAQLQLEIDAEENRAQNREHQLQSEIDAEKFRAEAREYQLQASIDYERARAELREQELQAEIDLEESNRIAGDASTLADAMQYTNSEVSEVIGDASMGYNTLGKIEDKIEFIMSNTDPAALDSLTEIVQAYQAADSDIYEAITNLNSSNTAAVYAERDRALAREAELQAEIDAEETRAQAREAQLQAEIDAEEVRAQAREAQLQTEIDAEEVRAQAREAELQAEIDAEEIARENAVAAEAALRMAADEEEASIRAAADQAEAAARQAADEAEAFARMTADDALDARLDVIEGDETVEGSVAKAKADAKAYADSKVAEVVGSATVGYNTLGKLEDKIKFIMSNTDPAALDSLTELLAAYQAADSNVYASVSALVQAERERALAREAELQSEIDFEEARAAAAEAALSAEIDAEEARAMAAEAAEAAARAAEDAAIRAEIAAFKPMAPVKFVLTMGEIADQRIELAIPYASLVEHSVIANVDRLYLLPEELVASPSMTGHVCLTFAGDIASGGEQALEAGDVLTIRYWVR